MLKYKDMGQELWNLFPRLLEEKINALLDEAEPNSTKAFQLYKSCQRENLWQDSFEKFSQHLTSFFSLPKSERRKSLFDSYLDRPMDMSVYEDFQLNFRTAVVNRRSVLNVADWAHHIIRLNHKNNSVVISTDILTRTLHYITNPPIFEKARDIEFEDFCAAWKKIVFKIFGKKYDAELEAILKELHWLDRQITEAKNSEAREKFFPSIYLTQTEIDWTTAVQKAVCENLVLPKYPLARGPQKQRLIDLERAVSLYRIVQSTQLPELIQHRDKIYATILDQCERLLRERAR